MSRHLVNLLPHAVRLVPRHGDWITLPPSGVVARVATAEQGVLVGGVMGVEVYGASTWDRVLGLPAPDADPNAIYIVSAKVADRCGQRKDVVYPGTGPDDDPVRVEGQVVAVTRLVSANRSGWLPGRARTMLGPGGIEELTRHRRAEVADRAYVGAGVMEALDEALASLGLAWADAAEAAALAQAEAALKAAQARVAALRGGLTSGPTGA